MYLVVFVRGKEGGCVVMDSKNFDRSFVDGWVEHVLLKEDGRCVSFYSFKRLFFFFSF